MSEITFTAELPDGSFQPSYSPSPVVRDYFRQGQQVPACEFIRLSREALTEACRLAGPAGVAGRSAYTSLAEIERWAGALPPETPLTILYVG